VSSLFSARIKKEEKKDSVIEKTLDCTASLCWLLLSDEVGGGGSGMELRAVQDPLPDGPRHLTAHGADEAVAGQHVLVQPAPGRQDGHTARAGVQHRGGLREEAPRTPADSSRQSRPSLGLDSHRLCS